MKKLNKYDKAIFESPWCPLFGELPFVDRRSNSQPARCIDVIKRARTIWSAVNQWELWAEGANISSWPEPAEVSCYDETCLESARSIFRTRHSIFQHIMVIDDEKDTFRSKNGVLKEAWTPKDRADLLSWFGNDSGAYEKVDEKTPNYAFLAILALGLAWDSLENAIEENERPWTVEKIQNSTELIAFAESMEYKDEIDAKKSCIKKLWPLAETGWKVRVGQSNAGKSTQEKVKERLKPIWDEWQKEADEIWERNPGFSRLTVATSIKNKLRPVQTIRTIWNHIKKPSL